MLAKRLLYSVRPTVTRAFGGSLSEDKTLVVPKSNGRMMSTRAEERITATLIPGDGVGPELVASVEEVFRSISVPVDFEVYFMSEVHSALSTPVDTVVDSIARNGLCLKGILTTPSVSSTGEADTLNIRLRRSLDLYANVVKVQSVPGVKARHGPLADPPSDPVDLVVIREQTEGEYACLEHESVSGVVESLKVVTAKKSLRIAKFAFDYATKHGRKKVTAIHKANIMKLGDGLFLRSCQEISELYPHIQFDEMIVDNACMQMVSKPQQFDVMVMPNLYGNILANLAAGLVGGAGLVAGEGYSKECAVFEPGARWDLTKLTCCPQTIDICKPFVALQTLVQRAGGQERGKPGGNVALCC